MTREETNAARKVMKHFEKGGKVQVRWRRSSNSEWQDTENPKWNWDIFEYRKKPQVMGVTKKEKELMKQIWVKNKKTENVYAVLDKKLITDDFIDNHYFLDPDKQEWIEIESDSKERLRHHYNGGQP